METQTRYDLNASIESWRQELAAQANLTADVRRELETHLRDTIAGFQQRGLNDEESFWLARRRVGQPQQLGEEFVKADPAKVWRGRVFWGAVILLVFNLWTGLATMVWGLLRALLSPYIVSHFHFISPFPDWVRYYVPLPSNINLDALLFGPTSHLWVYYSSFLVLAILGLRLARGKTSKGFSWVQFFFQSRRRFLFVSATAGLFYLIVCLNALFRQGEPNSPAELFMGTLVLTRMMYWGILVTVIALLLPTQNQKTPKRA